MRSNPELVLQALGPGLDRPQPIEIGADSEVLAAAGSFGDYEPPVTLATRQLLYLEAAALDELATHGYPPDEREELGRRSHVVMTWLVTHVAAVRLRAIALAALRHPLTDLFSKQAFSDDLAQRLTGEDELGLTVVAIDLDNFKRVNDTLGHAGGDDALKRFALALAQATGTDGSAYHLSGDEFALILHAGDPEGITNRATAQSLVECSFGAITVSFPLGDSDTAEEVHNRADQRLLLAKRAKKGWLVRLGLRLFRGFR